MAEINPLYTQLGMLQATVFEATSGIPVENARVSIRLRNDSEQILEEVTTNSSGQTPEIDLPAPPVEFSLEEAVEMQPYSEYDLVVSADGFETTTIDGTQILSGTEALQPVQLFQLSAVHPELTTVQIEANTLWGTFPPKIPEPEVKPLPPARGFVVLPEVVIPETIVVHDGIPSNASAKNYWVPFKSYIKNVASCEIYSTWPDATIRANVLAIISFTLNRVYTEWYRGKGYNFTITSSTAYDHAFSYGRNFYKSISVIVDEMFATFVTKPNIRQPLLTQYCDGRNVQCPRWMSQWGSKDLGSQGYSAVNILKHYYGNDIYLTQAKQVAGIPQSYPGSPLRIGSTGTNVRTIQTQLNAIANNFPAVTKGRVDGVFGPVMQTQVKNFQRIFALPVTGVVDYSTWYKISSVFVATQRLAELQ